MCAYEAFCNRYIRGKLLSNNFCSVYLLCVRRAASPAKQGVTKGPNFSPFSSPDVGRDSLPIRMHLSESDGEDTYGHKA